MFIHSKSTGALKSWRRYQPSVEYSDLRRYTGRTWCVETMTTHKVIVRRVVRDETHRVMYASVPTIQGSMHQCDSFLLFF